MTALTRDTLSLAWKSWYSHSMALQGPRWLQWGLTGVVCSVIALCFTVLGMALTALDGGQAWGRPVAWAQMYGRNLVISGVIGYLIHVMYRVLIPLIGRPRIQGWSEARRRMFFSAVPMLGVVIGWPLGVGLVAGHSPGVLSRATGGTMVGVVLLSILISFIFFQVFGAKARQVVAERQAVEAQLKLLQAQMEPHFLFNTLAGVQTLIDVDPARAKRMLEGFTDYLRATIASLRTEDSTVGQELALAEAYLGLMQQRMEDRLRFSFAVDDSVRAMRLPPLLLQPLVENAIHHGLEPKLEGGQVHVRARRDGSSLRIDVTDDGLGTDAPRRLRRGNGVALSNIRQRLQGRWGDRASLRLTPAEPGTRAELTIPVEEP